MADTQIIEIDGLGQYEVPADLTDQQLQQTANEIAKMAAPQPEEEI